MKIGYARVSTHDQSPELQTDALQKAGCERLFVDTISGLRADRHGLAEALSHAREGDTLMVWRLDRLGRSLKDLIRIVGEIEDRGISLVSLQESIDTGSSTGKLTFHIFGALAEFERNLIRERTRAGLDAARSRGRKGGRPTALSSEQKELVVKLYEEKRHTVGQICEMMGISRPTLYRYVETGRIL